MRPVGAVLLVADDVEPGKTVRSAMVLPRVTLRPPCAAPRAMCRTAGRDATMAARLCTATVRSNSARPSSPSGPEQQRAGVADERVQAAALAGDPVDRRGHRRRVGAVRPPGDGPPPGRPDLPPHAVGAPPVLPEGQRHVRAVARETQRHGADRTPRRRARQKRRSG